MGDPILAAAACYRLGARLSPAEAIAAVQAAAYAAP